MSPRTNEIGRERSSGNGWTLGNRLTLINEKLAGHAWKKIAPLVGKRSTTACRMKFHKLRKEALESSCDLPPETKARLAAYKEEQPKQQHKVVKRGKKGHQGRTKKRSTVKTRRGENNVESSPSKKNSEMSEPSAIDVDGMTTSSGTPKSAAIKDETVGIDHALIELADMILSLRLGRYTQKEMDAARTMIYMRVPVQFRSSVTTST